MPVSGLIGGRAFRMGDGVNTDVIIPGRYLIYVDPEPLAQHAFEVLGEGYPAKLRGFDVLVAGANFGCGSAREQAATAIIGLGIKAVIACSFARSFFRNAINAGLPIVECPKVYPFVQEGDNISIDLVAGEVIRDEQRYPFPRLPDSIREILERGGLVPYLRAKTVQTGERR